MTMKGTHRTVDRFKQYFLPAKLKTENKLYARRVSIRRSPVGVCGTTTALKGAQ
jgi:hypothetical protein